MFSRSKQVHSTWNRPATQFWKYRMFSIAALVKGLVVDVATIKRFINIRVTHYRNNNDIISDLQRKPYHERFEWWFIKFTLNNNCLLRNTKSREKMKTYNEALFRWTLNFICTQFHYNYNCPALQYWKLVFSNKPGLMVPQLINA